jgi:hypothetical protein
MAIHLTRLNSYKKCSYLGGFIARLFIRLLAKVKNRKFSLTFGKCRNYLNRFLKCRRYVILVAYSKYDPLKYKNIREEELKNKVGADWFKTFDTTEIIGNIDFSVFPKQADIFGRTPLLWAEAKQATSTCRQCLCNSF